MPILDKDELWRQLKEGFLAPVYVLHGAETYLRDRAAYEVTDRAFRDGGLRDFNEDEFSLNDPRSIEAAISAAEQLPMMSTRRVVKLSDVKIASGSARDSLKEHYEDLLARFLNDPPAASVVIFIADELNGNRKLTKLLKKHACCVEFEPLDEGALEKWIRRTVSDLGSEIEESALRQLVRSVGSDLRRLTNEIDKLATAALPSKLITHELVDSLAITSREIENFALTDAMISSGGAKTLPVMKKILDDGAEPVALLGLLSYNFRRLLSVKEMMSQGDDRRAVERVVNLRYRDQEAFLAAARRADREKLLNAIKRLSDVDLAMKTSVGGGGPKGTRMQFEVLVCELVDAIRN